MLNERFNLFYLDGGLGAEKGAIPVDLVRCFGNQQLVSFLRFTGKKAIQIGSSDNREVDALLQYQVDAGQVAIYQDNIKVLRQPFWVGLKICEGVVLA